VFVTHSWLDPIGVAGGVFDETCPNTAASRPGAPPTSLA
jgi:hypothetical protein